MSYYIVLGLGLVVSLIFCLKRASGFSVSNLLFKTTSSLCYLLTAVFALVENTAAATYGSLIIFGGALGLCGDISLDLKGLYKKDQSTYLQAGFIFFLIGHIFYTSAILYSIHFEWWQIVACVAAAILMSVGNIATSKIMKVHFGAYRNIVFMYVIFLAMTMMFGVGAMIISHFERKFVVLGVGAVAFTLSDVILSSTYFGKGWDKGYHYFINHFLYYAGQYLIASSILFM